MEPAEEVTLKMIKCLGLPVITVINGIMVDVKD